MFLIGVKVWRVQLLQQAQQTPLRCAIAVDVALRRLDRAMTDQLM
jgi:hypothetical protein